MRQYRAKRKDNGEWVHGWYAKIEDTHVIIDLNSEWAHEGRGDFIGDFFEVRPETVGQSTGLKDRNGLEIFEGDVVNWEYDELYDGGEKLRTRKYEQNEVFWSREFARFGLRQVGELGMWDFWCEDARFEVIGNVHSNPELLEQNA